MSETNRSQTRDRLMYDDCGCRPNLPPLPVPVMPISIFEDMMYKVVYSSGYVGTKADFKEDLVNLLNGAGSGNIALLVQETTIDNFPDVGIENCLYIDIEKKQMYFWKDNGYYRIQTGEGEGDGTAIPPDGLIYEGGII